MLCAMQTCLMLSSPPTQSVLGCICFLLLLLWSPLSLTGEPFGIGKLAFHSVSGARNMDTTTQAENLKKMPSTRHIQGLVCSGTDTQAGPLHVIAVCPLCLEGALGGLRGSLAIAWTHKVDSAERRQLAQWALQQGLVPRCLHITSLRDKSYPTF